MAAGIAPGLSKSHFHASHKHLTLCAKVAVVDLEDLDAGVMCQRVTQLGHARIAYVVGAHINDLPTHTSNIITTDNHFTSFSSSPMWLVHINDLQAHSSDIITNDNHFTSFSSLPTWLVPTSMPRQATISDTNDNEDIAEQQGNPFHST